MTAVPLGYGGAIYNAGNLALTGVTVRNNIARGRNGSLGVRGGGGAGGWGLGGGIYSVGSLILENSTLHNNQAQGGPGGRSFCQGSRCHLYPGGNGGWGEGGGVYVGAGTAELYNSIVTGNVAHGGTAGGGLYPGAPGRGIGGGIYVANASLGLDEFTLDHVSGNTASSSTPNIAGPYTMLPTPPPLPGDYNNDRTVDAADYVVWRKGLDTIYTPVDFNIWRAHFGTVSPATGAGSGAAGYPLGASAEPLPAAVPEPATGLLLIGGLVALASRSRRVARGENRFTKAVPCVCVQCHRSSSFGMGDYLMLVAATCTVVALPTTAAAANYAFTNVADISGPFSGFHSLAINDSGTVAFARFARRRRRGHLHRLRRRTDVDGGR